MVLVSLMGKKLAEEENDLADTRMAHRNYRVELGGRRGVLD